MIKAYAASDPGGELSPYEYDPGVLGADQVEIEVDYCGICHSDLSMLNNEWGMTSYPFVPGHEVVGTVTQVGEHVSNLQPGQKRGKVDERDLEEAVKAKVAAERERRLRRSAKLMSDALGKEIKAGSVDVETAAHS